MTIALVQGPKRAQSTTSSISITLDSAPTQGNLLVAVVGCADYSGVTANSITQTGVNWSSGGAGKQISYQYNDGSGDILESSVWVGIVGSGASTSLTITLSATPLEGAAADVFEYSGLATSSFKDKTATNHGLLNPPSTGTTDTTTQADELWVGCVYVYKNESYTGASNGFTHYDGIRITGVTYWTAVNAVAKIVSSTGTASSALTPTGAGTQTSACIVTLKGKVPTTVTYSTDVLLGKLGLTKTNSIDTLFKTLGITTTYDIDAIFARPPLPYDIDVLLKELGITAPFDIETLLAIRTTSEYSIDTNLSFFVWVTYLIDTQLKKQGITKTDSIDLILKKLGVTATDSIDVLFKKLDVTTTTSVDVILETLIPPTLPAEVPDTLKITNGVSATLWTRPIKWKESQTCRPAIRPIPLAKSEYLDADTWVLQPRTIECSIRLSDREKDMFETIYDYPSTLAVGTTNHNLDFYLIYYEYISSSNTFVPYYTWHYFVWIREKSYSFEYEYQNGRYVRWWTVSMICDVESFSGSFSTLPTWDSTPPTIVVPNPYFGFTKYSEDNMWKPSYKVTGHGYYDPMAKGVKIGDERLNHVIDFSRDDQHPPMIPNWVNQLAEVDSYIWNECVLDTSYKCRMTNAEKYHMDLLLQAHQKVIYEDYIHNIHAKAGGEQILNNSFEDEHDDGDGGWEPDNWISSNAKGDETGPTPPNGDWWIKGSSTSPVIFNVSQTLTNPVECDNVKIAFVWTYGTYASGHGTQFTVRITFSDTSTREITYETTSAEVATWVNRNFKNILTLGKTITAIQILVDGTETSTAGLIDWVSIVTDSGAWISSIEAQYSPTNWIKPWEVTIALQANNSETENRTANVTISASYSNGGNMYLDELPQDIFSYPVPTIQKCGVHKLYFFQPNSTIWGHDDGHGNPTDYNGWEVWGDALTLDIKGDNAYGIGGEHILTLLIYGDVTIHARWHYPPAPISCVVIALDSKMTGSANEAITNPDFEDGDFTGWTVLDATISSSESHSGSYSADITTMDTGYIDQVLARPIAKSEAQAFTLWTKSTYLSFKIILTFDDESTRSHNCDDHTNEPDWYQWDILSMSAIEGGDLFPDGKTLTEIKIIQEADNDLYVDDVSLSYIPTIIDVNAGIISIAGIPQGENAIWVSNGNFENGETDWSFYEGEVSTNNPHSGTHCASSIGYIDITQTLPYPVPVSEIISFKVWARCTETDNLTVTFGTDEGPCGPEYYQYRFGEDEYVLSTSWTEFDLKALMTSLGAGGNLLSIRFNSEYMTTDTAIDDVVLETGGLPADFVGAIEVGEHASTYALSWIIDPDPSHIDFTFDHWEVICGDITITNVNSASTTFKMNSGTIAWIRAVYEDLVDYQVDLSTNIDNPCSSASITINGVIYETPTSFFEFFGDYDCVIDGNPTGMYGNTYEFNHWIVGGGVTVDNVNSQTTIMRIRGNGTLEGFYTPITLGFDSRHITSGAHAGEIEHQWYPPPPPYDGYPEYPLPTTWTGPYTPDTFYINWNPLSSGKIFDHWEVTGAVTVDNPNNQATILHLAKHSGTITAVYKDA